MNKIFKVIWNHTTQRFDVVSELTRSKGKSSSQTDKRISLVKNAVALATVGGAVIGGQAQAAVVTYAPIYGTIDNQWSIKGTAIGSGSKSIGESTVAYGTNAQTLKLSDVSSSPKASTLVPGGAASIQDGDSIEKSSSVLGAEARTYGQQATAVGNSAEAVIFSTAVGQNAKAMQYASVATGQDAHATGKWSTATGVQAKALADYSNAIGGKAQANSWGSTAVGKETIVTGDEGTAVGYHADVKGRDGTASGAQSLAGEKATATGAQAKAEGTNATASGFKSNASGNNSVASGVSSTANASGAIAIGDSSGATKEDAIAIGHGAASGGVSSTAIGDGTMIMPGAVNSTAIGTASSIQGTSTNAYSLGTHNSIGASNVAVVGNNNIIQPTASNTMVLGNNVTATKPNSVILGEGSTDRDYTQVTCVTIPNIADGTSIVYDGFNGTATGIVSIGSKGKERQLTNVAPGEISATSTDTINGSQLYAVAYKLGEQVSNIYFHTNLNEANQGAGDPTTNKGRILDKAGATGAFSITAGVAAKAISENGIAIGKNSNSTGSAVVIGANAAATGLEDDVNTANREDAQQGANGAVAIGENARASASKGSQPASIAIGQSATAAGVSVSKTTMRDGNEVNLGTAIAIGAKATAKDASVAIGQAADAGLAQFATAVGVNSRALGDRSSAYGVSSLANGQQAVAVGFESKAEAQYSTAIGSGSLASQDGATAIGSGATSQSTLAIALGKGSLVHSGADRSMSIGDMSEAHATATIAQGYYAIGKGADGVAIGTASRNFGANSTAVGSRARGTGASASAFGHQSHATGDNTTAVGRLAIASGANGIAIGQSSLAGIAKADVDAFTKAQNDLFTNERSTRVAQGKLAEAIAKNDTPNITKYQTELNGLTAAVSSLEQAFATAKTKLDTAKADTIAIGTSTKALGTESIAIGKSSNVTGNQSIAVGVGHTVEADNAGAFGDPSHLTAEAIGSYAVGNNNTITSANTFVLGSGIGRSSTDLAVDSAEGTVANSVYLGNESEVTKGVGLVGTDGVGTLKTWDKDQQSGATATTAGAGGTVSTAKVGGITYGTASIGGQAFAGATSDGAVSVGSSGAERRIQNVAAGEISKTSTDAINGSQLYAVAHQASKPITFKANSNKDTLNATMNFASENGLERVLGDEIVIKGANGNIPNLSRNSDAATAGTYSARNVQTVVDDQGVQIQIATNPIFDSVQFGSNSGPKITNEGTGSIKVGSSSGSPVKITNVAAGSQPNDAVNLSQLNATSASVEAGDNTHVKVTDSAIGGKIYTVHADKAVVQGGNGVDVAANTVTNQANGTKTTTYTVTAKVDDTTIGVTSDGKLYSKVVDTDTNTDTSAHVKAADGSLVTVTKADATRADGITQITDYTVDITKGAFNGVTTAGKLNADGTTAGVATVADVITAVNSGFWTANVDGNTKVADVKFGDSVNFADGNVTDAKLAADGKSVTFDVKTDGTTIKTEGGQLSVNVDNLPKAVVAEGSNVKVKADTQGTTTTYTVHADKSVVAPAAGTTSVTVTPSEQVDQTTGSKTTTYNVDLSAETKAQIAKVETVVAGDSGLVTVDDSAVNTSTGKEFKVDIAKGTFNNPSTTGELAAGNTGVATVADVVDAVNKGFLTTKVAGNQVEQVGFGDDINFVNGAGTTARIVDGVNGDKGITFDANLVSSDSSITIADKDGAKNLTVNTGVSRVEDGGKAVTTDGDQVANLGDVVETINKTSWKVNSTAQTGGEGTYTANEESKINAGDTLNIDAGKNIKISGAGNTLLVETKDDVTFDEVTTRNLTATGDTVVKNFTVQPQSTINMGNNQIKGVAEGTEGTDAVNVDQLKREVATAKAVEKVTADTSADNIATVTQKSGKPAGEANEEYVVSVSKAAVKTAAQEAIEVVGDAKAITVDKTDVGGVETFKVNYNGAEAAKTTPLTYKANGENRQTVNLSEGLNFTNGDKTVATVGADGKVSFDLSNEAKTQLAKVETVVAGDSGLVTVNDTAVNTSGGKEFKVDIAKGTFNAQTANGALGDVTNTNGVATVADVVSAVNSGYWTAKVDGAEYSKVKFGDSVNFIDGAATNAKVGTDGITFDVKTDGTTIKVDNQGNLAVNTDGLASTEVVSGKNTTVTPTVTGNKTTYKVDATKTTVTAATDGKVEITGGTEDPNGVINYTVGLDAATKNIINNAVVDVVDTDTVDLTKTADNKIQADVKTTTLTAVAAGADKAGQVNAPVADDAKKLVNAQDLATVINNSGWNVKGDVVDGGMKKGTHATTLINPGETVTLRAGKNLALDQATDVFTYSLQDDISLNSVTTVDLTATGTTTVNDFTVKPNSAVDMGGNTLTNVGTGGDTDTNGANIGDIKRIAAKSVEKVVLDNTVADNIATVNTESGDAAGNAGETYKVGVSKQAVKTAAKEAINVTGTAPISVAKTDEGGVDTYTVKFDGTKAAESIPLTYKANGVDKQTVSLKDGLNFTDGDKTVATVGVDGKVSFDLSDEAKEQLAKEESVSTGTPDLLTVTKDKLNDTKGQNYKVDVVKGVFNTVTNPTGSIAAPTKDGVATTNDVVNAINQGYWTAQVGGTTLKPVHFGDTLNFVNGNGTKAVAKEGAVSYDVNLVSTDSTVTFAPGADGAVDIKVNTANLPKTVVKAGSGPVKVDAEGNNYTVSVNTTTITPSADQNTNGSVGGATDPSAVMTAGDVITTIKNAGFKLTASANGGAETGSTVDSEVINPGDTVDMAAGKNLVVKQEANGKITYATADVVSFTDVNTNNLTATGNTKVNNFAVGAGSTVDMGGNQINNVGAGVEDGDAVTIAQLKANTTKVVAGDNIAGVETSKDANGVTYTINAKGAEVAQGDGITVTATPNADTNVTTYTVALDQATKDKLAEETVVDATGLATVKASKTGATTTYTVNVEQGEFGSVTTDGELVADKDGVATVNDVVKAVNEGYWTAKVDGTEHSKVKFGDAINFANGKGTDANVTAEGSITFDVKTDGTTIKLDKDGNLTVNTDNLPKTKLVNGKNTTVEGTGTDADPYKVNVQGNLADITSISNGDTTIKLGDATVNVGGATITNVANGTKPGDAVNYEQLQASQEEVVSTDKSVTITEGKTANGAKKFDLSVTTDGTTIIKGTNGELKVSTTDLTNTPEGKVNVPTGAEANKLATASDIATAINDSGFTVKANGDAGELVNPGDVVEFKNGKNINITRDGSVFTVKTVDTPVFSSVQFNANGPIIKADASNNINIGKADGSATKITNVAEGTADNDAVNVKQLKDAVAANKTEIKAGDNVNITGDGSKDKPYVINAKDTTATASVKAGSSEFLTVTANGAVTANGTTTIDYAVGLTDKAKAVLNNAATKVEDTHTVNLTKTGDTIKADVIATDGKGTTANVTSKGLTFDVKIDGDTITFDNNGNLTVNTANLATTKLADGKNTKVTGKGSESDPYKVNVEGDLKDISSISNGDTSIKLGDATVNVGGATISNVKAGEKDGDAVNVSQLNETNQGWTITTSGNTDSKGVSSQVKLGKSAKPAEKTVTISGGKNIKVKQEGNTVSVATSDTPTFESVTVGGDKGVTVTSTTSKLDGKKELSVGTADAPTRITNVAPGVKDTDAVNVSQLKQVQGNVNAVNRKVDKLDKRVRGIGASSAAASSLPQVYIPGKSMVAAAAGGYDGASAVAVGYSRASDNGKLILKLQGTANSQGHVSGGVGVGYQW
ncbi:hypothetical protein EXH44_05230 [Actinobacillus indolicus]|uniref:Autotransporter adhesin n=1 Tax=Actinobacillus indolicus TaxID=51049 RepID=A0A4P7CHW2_9PAST|nr:YadA-like family protein [Actinobacillus indolicus]QBQ63675.1 hypothetical protein EXH44_05230 [Actinobacillus indolicus]